MNAIYYLLIFLGTIGLVLIIFDYRDHAKEKKEEKEKETEHNSTFFPDEKG